MKLRIKILALSMALLAALCAALSVSLRLQREMHAEIASNKDHHLPLAAMRAEAESAAPGYQLLLAKAVGTGVAGAFDAIEKEPGQVMGHLVAELDGAQSPLARAIAAPVGELPSATAVLHERWAEALDRYRARNWRAAKTALAGCLEVAPEDGPARLFCERIARFDAATPPADWDGVWRLEEV